MQAAVTDRYGPPEVVTVRDFPRPEPTADEVLVRVAAASVNRADLDGLYPRWQFTRVFSGFRRPREPRIGLDVAGVVEAVGPEATRFRPGDLVFGDLFSFHQGAFAEYVCAPERAFDTIPDGLPLEDAATLPHSAILALQGLRRRDGSTFGPGARVLVVGASGNVGPFAVQVAKARGAHVTGVTRTEKLDFVRSLGVDDVIDYTTTDWTAGPPRFDWILDVEARHSLLRARRPLRRGGSYVSLGGPTARIFEHMLAGGVVSRAISRRMGLLLWWKPFHAPDVAVLKELLAAGLVRPVIDRRYALNEVVEALRYVDAGRARGKVLVLPRPPESPTLDA
jgi:NADPH:quinone reductase-like Zn-dependent oxidoreductase